MNKEILNILEANSRVSYEEIALRTGLTLETVIKEIKEAEDNKIICGYPTLINWDKTSEEKVTALIEVKVQPQRGVGYDKIAERIYRFDEVDAVYLMAADYDFMVLIEGETMKDISKFVFEKLATLETVTSTGTHFVLKKYKEHQKVFDTVEENNTRMKVSL